MFPIADYPTIVKDNLPYFEYLFTKPQLRHFAEYLTGLYVCDNHTVQGINDSFIGHRDQSNKNRFLTKSKWSEKELNKRRIELALAKAGSDGCYALGHQLVTSHFAGVDIHFPIDCKLYEKREDNPEKFETKIQLAKELIEAAVGLGIPFSDVVSDCWYLCKRLTSFIESLGKGWIFGCKSNRIIIIDNQRISLSDYAKDIPREEFKRVEKGNKSYWCFTKVFLMSNQGKVRIVIYYDNEELEGAKFLATNHLTWDARKILCTYARRWTIETFYRDSKQNLGWEECELRTATGITRHWYLVILADTFLRLSSDVGSLVKWLKSNLRTVGERRRLAAKEVLRSFILWVIRQKEKIADMDEILRMAFSSRQELKGLSS